jgi:hypothetical protein
MHPEAMLYATRTTQGRLQDLQLTAAACIGKIKIDEKFYEISHRRNYGKMCRVEWARQKILNAQSIAEVRHAIEHRDGRKALEMDYLMKSTQNASFLDFPGIEPCDISDEAQPDDEILAESLGTTQVSVKFCYWCT